MIILALFCRQVTRIRVSNSPEVTQKLMVGLGCEFRPFQLRFHAGNSSRKISIHLYSTLLIIFLTISNLLLNHSSNFFFLSHWTFQTQNFQLVFFFNKLFVEILYLFIIMIIILSFSLLNMVFFSSLNLFIKAALKSSSAKSNIWVLPAVFSYWFLCSLFKKFYFTISFLSFVYFYYSHFSF